MMPSPVFVPAVALHTKLYLFSKVLRNLWSTRHKRPHMLCRRRESIWPGSLWKAFRSVAGVRCWRPPVTGRQVTTFLVRSLCRCRESEITTVHRCCWTPTRVRAVTTPLHSLHEWDRQS